MGMHRAAVTLALTVASLLVCAVEADAAVKTTHVIKRGTLPAGTNSVTHTARCPDRMKALGGGVAPTWGAWGHVDLVGSMPFDGPDAGKTPDDGWRGIVSNGSGHDRVVEVFAICASGLKPTYVSASTPAQPSTRQGSAVSCPNGMDVLSGGVAITGRSSYLATVFSSPADGGDLGPHPDDAWAAAIWNGSGVAQTMAVHAVCAPVEAAFASQSANSGPGETGTSMLACPESDETLTGGGVAISTSSSFASLISAAPVEEGGVLVAWSNSLENATGAQFGTTAWTICLPPLAGS